MSTLPFKDNEFDMVISFDVMEHIDRSNMKNNFQTVRVAKKQVLHKIYTTGDFYYVSCSDPTHASVFPNGFGTTFTSLPKYLLTKIFPPSTIYRIHVPPKEN